MTPHEAAGTQPLSYEKSDGEKKDVPNKAGLGVWQHVLSVGRDGRCLLQSFARGKQPSKVFCCCKYRFVGIDSLVGIVFVVVDTDLEEEENKDDSIHCWYDDCNSYCIVVPAVIFSPGEILVA